MSDLVLGIDLGTSNSVVAVVKGGKVIVMSDGEGRRIHPSVVSFHPNGSILVGQKAKSRRIIDPRNTVYSVKRLIGRRFHSNEVKSAIGRVPYAIKEGAHQQPMIAARGDDYAIPEISALVLAYIKQVAEGYFGQPISKAVITVPANFNDTQREATRAAGTLAGLDVVRVLNEPTAAALAYGYGKGIESRIAIFDFGGGTFDVTILQLSDRIYEVLATAGDTYLGGDDIDHRLVDFMCQAFLAQHRVDLRGDALAMERLRAVAEQIKIQLSSRAKAVVQVQEIARGVEGRPIDLSFSITREGMNQRILDIVDRAFVVCDEALRLCGLSVTQIDDVVLVGGTTRTPLVRERVAAYFGREPRADINPDEVVAIGAAIQGAALSRDNAGEQMNALLLDVTPRSLGIATVGGFADTIIPRNAQIPLEQTRQFSTTNDDQTQVKIQVCQGESRRFDENIGLGELTLYGLRPAGRGEVKIAVTFEIDVDGILRVRAQDEETGRAQAAKIQLLGTLSEEELADLVARKGDKRKGGFRRNG